MNFITIDQAKTTGLAFNLNTNIYYFQVTTTPQELLQIIQHLVDNFNITTIVFERFVYFSRSAKTQLSLMMLIGYLYHSLSTNNTIEFLSPLTYRKGIGFAGKENNKDVVFKFFKQLGVSSNNESDAISMLLYKLNLTKNDNYKLYKYEHNYKTS